MVFQVSSAQQFVRSNAPNLGGVGYGSESTAGSTLFVKPNETVYISLSYDTSKDLSPPPEGFKRVLTKRVKEKENTTVAQNLEDPGSNPERVEIDLDYEETKVIAEDPNIDLEKIDLEKHVHNCRKTTKKVFTNQSPHWKRIDVKQKKVTRGLAYL